METQQGGDQSAALHGVQTALREVQAQCRRLRILAISSTIGLIALAGAMLALQLQARTLVRTRGIVIEDEAGRDRLLIGYPIPPSRGRVRTDLARVESTWAPRLGGAKFMEAYRSYDNSASGLVFLNEQGFDKLVLGEKMPDPNTGVRLVDSAGFSFNDDEGFECGGLGVSKTPEGKTRVVMGMDDPKVGEALHLFVMEDGSKGLRIASEDGLLLLGRAVAGNEIFQNAEPFLGMLVKDAQGKLLLEQNALKK